MVVWERGFKLAQFRFLGYKKMGNGSSVVLYHLVFWIHRPAGSREKTVKFENRVFFVFWCCASNRNGCEHARKSPIWNIIAQVPLYRLIERQVGSKVCCPKTFKSLDPCKIQKICQCRPKEQKFLTTTGLATKWQVHHQTDQRPSKHCGKKIPIVDYPLKRYFGFFSVHGFLTHTPRTANKKLSQVWFTSSVADRWNQWILLLLLMQN